MKEKLCMTHNEIFESEKRNYDNSHLIHLYYEGTWWRAYEWSAYLLYNYPLIDDAIPKLNPTKKKTSVNENGLIFVGLQLKSFDKYLPFIRDKEQFEEIQNKHIIINVKDVFSEEIFQNYESLLIEWKKYNKFSLKHPKKNIIKEQTNISINNDNNNEVDIIINEIKNWETIHKSMVDTYMFFINIQNKIKNL